MSTDISTKVKEQGYEMVIFNALKNSLYPGAKDESILMVLDYCKAANLNPMLKPGHLVPMKVKNPVTGVYEWRDVYMPGIAEYRIRAARSGEYAGVTAPEYGPDVTQKLGGKEFTYPEWCKVTVKKYVKGNIAEFSAQEYWEENYATGKDTTYPNSMWAKRRRGQIAKCAEAQALRRAFPEILGGVLTAEEMEGKIHWVNDEVESKAKANATGNEGLKDILGVKDVKAAIETIEDALGMTEEEKLNLETGEIIDIEAIKQQIQQAKNNAELTDAAQKISSAGDAISEEEKKELKKCYRIKLDELKKLEAAIE